MNFEKWRVIQRGRLWIIPTEQQRKPEGYKNYRSVTIAKSTMDPTEKPSIYY